jgi:hypothetical protein
MYISQREFVSESLSQEGLYRERIEEIDGMEKGMERNRKKKRVRRSREWEREGGKRKWEDYGFGGSRIEDHTANWMVPCQNSAPF